MTLLATDGTPRLRVAVAKRWAGPITPWRNWMKWPLFSSIPSSLLDLEPSSEDTATPPWLVEVSWIPLEKTLVIVDLEGEASIWATLSLGLRGYRPVLGINATSFASEIIDQSKIIEALAEGATYTLPFAAPTGAPPVFALDARRSGRGLCPSGPHFDNRWTLFEGDLPPAKLLREEGIDSVLVWTRAGTLEEDLAPLAALYVKEGVTVRVANGEAKTIEAWTPPVVGWLSATLAGLKRRISYRRHADGSFGRHLPPEPSHG